MGEREWPAGLFTKVALGALVSLGLAMAPAMAQLTVPQSEQEIQLTFAPVVAETAPAVVNVFTTASAEAQGPINPLLEDPFFRRFFGDQFGLQPRQDRSSLGSGVIVRSDGLVVTNHHVIENAATARVVLSDGREFQAEILVSDERTDLALMQIIDPGPDPFPVVSLGDSEALAVGDLVLAIGNPFGVGQTVTMGIVSAVARPARGVADFDYFIQTDAAINPGNSGGALVTTTGELIGINTAIYSRDGGSLGIGFAVPANMVAAMLAAVERGLPLARPWMGVGSQEITPDLAESLGLDRPRGALVTSVADGSPGSQAGLRPGDVIARFGGGLVESPSVLEYRLATALPGSSVELSIYREGEIQALLLPIELPPEDPPRDVVQLTGRHPFAGAVIANLSPALVEEVGFPHGYETGVVVLDVARGSPADRIGLQSFDRPIVFNGIAIERTSQLDLLIQTSAGPWRIAIMRGDRRLESVFAR